MNVSTTDNQIKEQYELLPYPPRDPEEEKVRLLRTVHDNLDHLDHSCFGGTQDYRHRPFSVLVPGAGTGDSVIYLAEQLRRNKMATVTYVDISAASMEIAKARAEQRGLNNIVWKLRSITDLNTLEDGRFDYISCSGVLHHLEGPDYSLERLCRLLHPKGAMGIMVYATYGRLAAWQTQELLRRLNKGVFSVKERIDRSRLMVQNLPSSHRYRFESSAGDDSRRYGDSGFFDELLHPRERSFTLPEILEWTESCGLKLREMLGIHGSGNVLYNPHTYAPNSDVAELIHYDTAYSAWALAELINGGMTSHTFYAVKTENNAHPPNIRDEAAVPYWAGRLGVVRNGKTKREALLHSIRSGVAQKLQYGSLSFSMSRANNESKLNVLVPLGEGALRVLEHVDGYHTIKQLQALTSKEDVAEFIKLYRALNDMNCLYAKWEPGPNVTEEATQPG